MINRFFVSRKYHDGACAAYEDAIADLVSENESAMEDIKHLNRKVYELEQRMKTVGLYAARIKAAAVSISDHYDVIRRNIDGK